MDKYVPHMNRVAYAVGINLDWSVENTPEGYLFNGHTVAAGNKDLTMSRNGGQDSRGVLHEIAHFLVADPESRCLPNYGLGNADFTKESGTLKTPSNVMDEEVLACVVEIELARHIFGDKYAGDVVTRTCSDFPHNPSEVKELRTRGILNSKGRLSDTFSTLPKWESS